MHHRPKHVEPRQLVQQCLVGPDSVRQNGFLWCSRHECLVKESRWVATQLETEYRLSVVNDNEVLEQELWVDVYRLSINDL